MQRGPCRFAEAVSPHRHGPSGISGQRHTMRLSVHWRWGTQGGRSSRRSAGTEKLWLSCEQCVQATRRGSEVSGKSGTRRTMSIRASRRPRRRTQMADPRAGQAPRHISRHEVHNHVAAVRSLPVRSPVAPPSRRQPSTNRASTAASLSTEGWPLCPSGQQGRGCWCSEKTTMAAARLENAGLRDTGEPMSRHTAARHVTFDSRMRLDCGGRGA